MSRYRSEVGREVDTELSLTRCTFEMPQSSQRGYRVFCVQLIRVATLFSYLNLNPENRFP